MTSFAAPIGSTQRNDHAHLTGEAGGVLHSTSNLKTQMLAQRLGVKPDKDRIEEAVVEKLQETHDIKLLASCFPLLTDELMEALYNKENNGEKNFSQYIRDLAEDLTFLNTPIPDENVLLKELGSLFDFYLTVMNVFLESIYTTFGIAGEGEGNASTFDADHRLNIMLKCFFVPIGALLLLAPAVGAVSVPVYLLLAVGLTIGFLTLLWIYKQFRPPPHCPAHFTNLSKAIREQNIHFDRPIEGRQRELEKLRRLFCGSHRPFHALIHGSTRIGKTQLICAFAKNNPDIEVYEVTASQLMNEFSFEQQFRTIRREFRGLNKRVVLCFDEVHAFFEGNNRKYAETFNSFISSSGISTISITTDHGYQAIQSFYNNETNNPFFARQKKKIELKDLTKSSLDLLLLNAAKAAYYSYDDNALKTITEAIADPKRKEQNPTSSIQIAIHILDRAEATLGKLPPITPEQEERQQQFKAMQTRLSTDSHQSQDLSALRKDIIDAERKRGELQQKQEDFKKMLDIYRKETDEVNRLAQAIMQMDTPLAHLHQGTLSKMGQLYYIKRLLQRAIKHELKALEDALEAKGCKPRLTTAIAHKLLNELGIQHAKKAASSSSGVGASHCGNEAVENRHNEGEKQGVPEILDVEARNQVADQHHQAPYDHKGKEAEGEHVDR